MIRILVRALYEAKHRAAVHLRRAFLALVVGVDLEDAHAWILLGHAGREKLGVLFRVLGHDAVQLPRVHLEAQDSHALSASLMLREALQVAFPEVVKGLLLRLLPLGRRMPVCRSEVSHAFVLVGSDHELHAFIVAAGDGHRAGGCCFTETGDTLLARYPLQKSRLPFMRWFGFKGVYRCMGIP